MCGRLLLSAQRYVVAAIGWNANLSGSINPVKGKLSVGMRGVVIVKAFGTVPHGAL